MEEDSQGGTPGEALGWESRGAELGLTALTPARVGYPDTTELPDKMFSPQDQTKEQGSRRCLHEHQRLRLKFHCRHQEHKGGYH